MPEPCQTYTIERFSGLTLFNFIILQKNSIIDILQGPEYTFDNLQLLFIFKQNVNINKAFRSSKNVMRCIGQQQSVATPQLLNVHLSSSVFLRDLNLFNLKDTDHFYIYNKLRNVFAIFRKKIGISVVVCS